MFRNKQSRGVVLLYAVLMVSIVLTISLTLLNITLKQTILSAVERDSQLAHFAALSAFDCVDFTDRLYGTLDSNPFGHFSSLYPAVVGVFPTNNSFACATTGGSLQINAVNATGFPKMGPNSNSIISHFNLSGPGLGATCAIVEVAKITAPGDYDISNIVGLSPDLAGGKTIVTAWGYNNCDPTNARRVERAVQSYFAYPY